MRKAIIAISALFGLGIAAGAQSKIVNESLVHDGKDAVVTFDIQTDENSIPSNRKEIILPYIYNGKDTLWLDAVEVFGKNHYKRQKQEHFLAGDKEWDLQDGQVLKGSVYSYRDTAPLKRWMQPANLGIRRNIVGCNCEKDLADQEVTSAPLFTEPALPARRIPSDFALSEVSRQWDFGQDELEIIFKVSKIEIDSSVFNNEVTFGKILSAVDKIFANPKFKLDQIEIAGYASPEGKKSFNQWLGENRAKALIDYIIANRPQYSLTRDHFKIRNGEENWEGLRRLTLASAIPDDEKQQIINVIDSDAGLARKDMLRSLNYGRTYLKMIEHVYPHLRCARYLAIYYDSTQDEAVDAINAANDMIREGKIAEAYDSLKPYDDDFRSFNSIGVVYMLQGEFEKALPWFQKALENDVTVAQKNVDIINAEFEYEAQMRKEREEYLKRFE
jgi:outer membrane protein OmpA-like peptidoglycan-associated protein